MSELLEIIAMQQGGRSPFRLDLFTGYGKKKGIVLAEKKEIEPTLSG